MSRKKIYWLISWLVSMALAISACGQTAQPASPGADSRTQAQAGQAKSETQEISEEHEADEQDKEGEAPEHAEDEPEHAEAMEAMELAPISLGAGEKLQVVATTNIIGDLARNVGGDLIELTILLPIGSDPHTFTPTPQDAVAIAGAHGVFINGLGLEEFLGGLVENAGGEASVIPVAAGVEVREFGEGEAGDEHGEAHDDEEQAEEHDEAEGEHAHEHSGIDAHIWTTPANAIVMVHNIEQALSALDPANAETYETKAEAYAAELETLDAWVKSQIETIPVENRKMVTDHGTFGYYADRYGLEIIGAVIPGYSTEAEPSAGELAGLQEAIGQYRVKAIFVGTTVNPVLARQVAEDTGIQLVGLYSDSLGEAGSGAETYLEYIRYNTRAIVEALR